MDLTSLLPSPIFLGSYKNTSDLAIETAANCGWDVVFGTPTLLLLDIDTPEQLLKSHICLAAVVKSKKLTIKEITYTISKGGKGWHLYVRLAEPIPASQDRSLIQALLGSDSVRETQGWWRAQAGDLSPILFWEKPEYNHRHPYQGLYEAVIKPLELAWKANLQNKHIKEEQALHPVKTSKTKSVIKGKRPSKNKKTV